MGFYESVRNSEISIFLGASKFDQSGQSLNIVNKFDTIYRNMSSYTGFDYRDMRETRHGSEILTFAINLNGRGSGEATEEYLSGIFYNGLGLEGRFVTLGETVWSGFLKSVELTYGGSTIGYDISRVCNQVKFRYDPDEDDDNPNDTGVYLTPDTEATSESKYRWGVHMCEFSDTQLGLTEAESKAQYELTRNLWPELLPLNDADNQFRIFFEFWGYYKLLEFMCNDFQFDGKSVQQCISEVLAFGGQGIINYSNSTIQDNGIVLDQDFSGTCLEAIEFLTERLSLNGDMWNWRIDPTNITFFFEPIEWSPYYYLRYGESNSSSGTFIGSSGNSRIPRFKGKANRVRRSTIYPVTDRRGQLFSDSIAGRGVDQYIEAVSHDRYGNASFELEYDVIRERRRAVNGGGSW